MLSAKSLVRFPVVSYLYKPANRSFAAERSALVLANIGFKVSNGPRTPSEYEPPEVYVVII